MMGILLGAKAFLGSSWKWLAAILIVASLAYVKGCTDGKQGERAKHAAEALKTSEKARAASEDATAAKDERDKQSTIETQELKDAIKTPSNEPVGTNTRTVLERLRRQQADRSKATGK